MNIIYIITIKFRTVIRINSKTKKLRKNVQISTITKLIVILRLFSLEKERHFFHLRISRNLVSKFYFCR